LKFKRIPGEKLPGIFLFFEQVMFERRDDEYRVRKMHGTTLKVTFLVPKT